MEVEESDRESDRKPLMITSSPVTRNESIQLNVAQVWPCRFCGIMLGICHLLLGVTLLIFDVVTNNISETAFAITASLSFIVCGIFSFIAARRLDRPAQLLLLFFSIFSMAMSTTMFVDSAAVINYNCDRGECHGLDNQRPETQVDSTAVCVQWTNLAAGAPTYYEDEDKGLVVRLSLRFLRLLITLRCYTVLGETALSHYISGKEVAADGFAALCLDENSRTLCIIYMAFTPERGALIVDSQYENEDQQFLEEIHLSKNNCAGADNASINSDQGSGNGFYSRDHSQQPIKTYARLRTIKTEPMDYDEQTCSENGRSAQSFGEDNASISETSQADYSVNSRYLGHSPRSTRGYDVLNYSTVEGSNQSGDVTLGMSVNRVVQEPGPIREDEERQDNGGLQGRHVVPAVWTPPTFRTYRPPCSVDWRHPRVRDVLRDYRNQKISSREGAELIAKITGSPVSTTTVRVKSRMLDELDAQCVESNTDSKYGCEVGGSDGVDANQSSRENGRIKCQASNANKALIPGVNAPIVAPPNSPYYLSFSRRFKQTSLTVPLNPDEVRLYRHASHSKSGRTIHFRCSRCDTLHQTYKSGEIARIKMVDGVVVSQLYPVHHERCKPIRLVEARAKEIERRCRKDIILGMNPKEAWKKGRKAAISEATAAGFPVYGPGSILSAFPEWDKVKALFGALRARYIRRQMHLKQRMSGKKNLDNDERKLETADFDMAEVARPKRSWIGQGGAYATAVRHDDGASTSGLENVAVSEGEEIVGNDFELDDFEEESLYNFMQNAGKVANCNQAYNISNNIVNNALPRNASNESAATSEVVAVEERQSDRQNIARQGQGTVDTDNSKMTYEVQEVERAIARASVPTFSEQLNRPPVLTPSRSSPSSSVISASVEGLSDVEKRVGYSRRKRKRSEDPKPGQDYITFVSPAGVLPCAEKKKKYTDEDATEKLKKIELYIAQYNALSDNKIATIHVSRGGDLKMHGSKYIVDACLHSSVIRDLKSKWREREEVDEEGVDDDELVSIPLIRCLPNLEINIANTSDVRAMLNRFLEAMHYPWKPWFGVSHNPDYWPPSVPFYDPNNDLLSLSTVKQRKEIEKHSIVDLERDILKYAFKHYISFMEYHFGLSGPNYDEDSRNIEGEASTGIVQQRNVGVSANLLHADPSAVTVSEMQNIETAKSQPVEVQEPASTAGSVSGMSQSLPDNDTVEQYSSPGASTNDISTAAASASLPLSSDRILEDQLSLFRNSVLRIRYDQMGADVRTIFESVIKIQNHSTCRTLVVFADERNKLSLSGDKTLISAFLSSNIPQCLPPAMSYGFDNQTITLPLLQLYEDTVVDRMTEDRALDLLDDMMMHVNFPWADPYDGTQPDCWPPEIPFCPPWSNNGRGILNRRIGANTPGQAAKVVLKSVRWFYSEMVLEKLKLEDGLKRIAPSLAELTHNLLQERSSALQTPVPRSASQEITPFRVPSKILKRSPSHRSYCTQLRTSSRHSDSSQELRIYDQSSLAAPPAEIRTDFAMQDLPYRGRTAPLSPSQHSVSSQETVPFRLPPHHPLANAHLALQQHSITEEPYCAQNYESPSESFIMSDDRGITVVTPAESCILQGEASFQNPKTVPAHSHVSTSRDFRMPRIPSQQTVAPEDRPASWTSRHSSASSGSRSSQSNKSSLHSSVRSESRGSVVSASSKQFAAPGHSYQVPAYNKSSSVRLHNQKEQQNYPGGTVAAKSHHTPYIVEENSASSFRTVTSRSTYSEFSASPRDVVAQGSFIDETFNTQLRFQQGELSRDFVAPQNPSIQQQEQQHQHDKGFIRVLCACGPGLELNANDCVRCNRCHKNFHSKCLPLKRRYLGGRSVIIPVPNFVFELRNIRIVNSE
uniref:Zinc finger PHD-type domain-containing protein n=1 Tax=Setaria digitata TaxID=48799 RepID=A0A915PYK8_9BILA